ncbi:MAG TPA: gluconokinase [Methylomirabilota bacterium]|nr:gluconokinase [Methylomirabilota bacterium]
MARPPAGPVAPLLLALDVGSSSVRALAFDAAGRALGVECQRPYEPDTTPDGGVEIDADRLLALSAEALDGAVAALGGRTPAVAAVATCTFWHTLLGLGADGRPRTPVYSWADTRSAAAVDALRARVDEKAYHARVGCRLHTSYLPARLWWLRTRAPAAFAAVRHWVSFGEYLGLRLCGELATSVSMASGTGLFDQRACRWDPGILEVLELDPGRLGPIADLDRGLGPLRPEFAARWPGLAGARWLPALADGACSNVGAGCTTARQAALMVGTSGAMRVCVAAASVGIPDGLWCYRVDRRRLLLGGSLANGGSVYAWLVEVLRLPAGDALEAAIAAMEPDAHGLTMLPFLAGERSLGWNAAARAALVGVSLATRPVDIVRAGLETVAYRFALIHERLRDACPDLREVVATGGALLASPAWTRIVADVLGVPLTPSTEQEGSSRGAALLASEALGLIPSVETVPAGRGPVIEPDPGRHARYRAGLARHRQLYDLLLPSALGERRPL